MVCVCFAFRTIEYSGLQNISPETFKNNEKLKTMYVRLSTLLWLSFIYLHYYGFRAHVYFGRAVLYMRISCLFTFDACNNHQLMYLSVMLFFVSVQICVYVCLAFSPYQFFIFLRLSSTAKRMQLEQLIMISWRQIENPVEKSTRILMRKEGRPSVVHPKT